MIGSSDPKLSNSNSSAGFAGRSIAVIGGGIAGLAAAHFLVKSGCTVELFEASDHFGGLGASFSLDGKDIEQFYHCMLPTDDELLQLMREIGYSTEVEWHETSFSVWDGHKFFPLNGAKDLLKFTPLSIVDRLRLGLTGLWGRLVSSAGLDDITAEQWLTRLSGKRAFELFWKTLLQAKFGDRYSGVPALWFWTRFNREKGEKKEAKGFPPGGYRGLTDAIVTSLEQRGAVLNRRTPVASLDLSPDGRPQLEIGGEFRTYDQVIVTLALPLVDKLIRAESKLRKAMAPVDFGIQYQAVINLLLVAKKSFSPHYWVASIDRSLPFQGIVETSKLAAPGKLNNRSLLYLMRYLDRDDPVYKEDPALITDRFLTAFYRTFPEFSPADIENTFLFKAPYVEPAYTAGYLRRRPPIDLYQSKLFLATTAQVYPTVTSWNGSVTLVRAAVAEMLAAKRGSADSPVSLAQVEDIRA